MSSFVGLLIEYWKLKKAFSVEIIWKRKSTGATHTDSNRTMRGTGTRTALDKVLDSMSGEHSSQTAPLVPVPSTASTSPSSSSSSSFPFSLLPFTLRYEVSRTYSESPTKQHDQTATTHLLYSLFPLVFGYSIYSLLYISVSISTHTSTVRCLAAM